MPGLSDIRTPLPTHLGHRPRACPHERIEKREPQYKGR